MLFRIFMKLKCPRKPCLNGSVGPKSGRVVRNGFFFRRSDSRRIQRYRCLRCRRSFSSATTNVCFGQRKRRLNFPIMLLLCSAVSLRRTARLLGIHRRTVERKLEFLARQARLRHAKLLASIEADPLDSVQFDELESSIHTKLKPVSVPLMVTSDKRVILGFDVAEMPANGLIAALSRKKYGPRADRRQSAISRLFKDSVKLLREDVTITTDENPRYPKLVQAHFPRAKHHRVKGKRGCVVGQGELKKIGQDPLFSLNHTCAMLRANINRLIRRTWCTSKRIDRLSDHLALYVDYHNRILVQN